MLRFVLVLVAVTGVVSLEKKPPTYNKYTVQGYIELPYAELKEPFTGYYDLSAGKGRVDYYGGTMKTWQVDTCYKEFYKTTETELNVKSCMVSPPISGPCKPQRTIPDSTLHAYTYTGQERLDTGVLADRFTFAQTIMTRNNTYTLWTHPKTGVPLKYKMMGYDSLMGSHYDKYYIVYTDYKTTVAPAAFDLPTDCSAGSAVVGTESEIESNPMSHYIEGVDAVDEMWPGYKGQHSKSYSGKVEEATRQHIFRQNLRFIQSRNRAGLTYGLAINHLADYTREERKALLGYRRVSQRTPQPAQRINNKIQLVREAALPTDFDWRLHGAVTQVKDQAICGSCWSFGSAEVTEGAYFLKTGKRVRLSQQELVDCSWGEGNNGCDGGEDVPSYQWISQHGLATEAEYGMYKGIDARCRAANMTGLRVFVEPQPRAIATNDPISFKEAMVANGPISVAIDASHSSFAFYSYGVYSDPDCSSSALDHAVLAVGYGAEGGRAYWLIKNSWSTYWGDNGYVLMAQSGNMCGVMTSPTQPIIK